MLRRNEGYFLTELLLSLTAWLIVTSCMLPIFLHLHYQAELLQLDKTAIHILYDELENIADKSEWLESKSVTINGSEFLINWKEDMNQTEVCVEYQDGYSITKKKCKSPE